MNIVVLNGSPKGEASVTMQYVAYMSKLYPQHDFSYFHISQRIKKLENDRASFDQIVQAVDTADLVLWASPVYFMLLPAQYMRFLELIEENNARETFAGTYAAFLCTSIHFYDHVAMAYMHSTCEDLGMPFVDSYSAGMHDLEEEGGGDQLRLFAENLFHACAQNVVVPRTFAPLLSQPLDYQPGDISNKVAAQGRRVLIVSEAQPDTTLDRMVHQLAHQFEKPAEIVHLADYNIKGGCLGCLRCGFDNKCAYGRSDDFEQLWEQHILPSDILVFASPMSGRHFSARWKSLVDRSFYMGHTPALRDKKVIFLVGGPLQQEAPLRNMIQAWCELEHMYLVGLLGDQQPDSVTLDMTLSQLAQQAAWAASKGYAGTRTFSSVGGMKVFRDFIWGDARFIFQADYRYYTEHKLFNFPTRSLKGNAMSQLMRIPGFRKKVVSDLKNHMIAPLKKIVDQTG